jgi:hypothetical protein
VHPTCQASRWLAVICLAAVHLPALSCNPSCCLPCFCCCLLLLAAAAAAAAVQSVGQIIGEVLRQLDEERCECGVSACLSLGVVWVVCRAGVMRVTPLCSHGHSSAAACKQQHARVCFAQPTHTAFTLPCRPPPRRHTPNTHSHCQGEQRPPLCGGLPQQG